MPGSPDRFRPQSFACRTCSTKPADSRSVLVGMQPRWRHVPPILSSSTRATLRPSWAARKAAVYPPVPAPSTTRSKSLEEPTAIGQEGLVGVPGRLLDHLAQGASQAVSIAVDGTRGPHGVANVGAPHPAASSPV